MFAVVVVVVVVVIVGFLISGLVSSLISSFVTGFISGCLSRQGHSGQAVPVQMIVHHVCVGQLDGQLR
ncbi:hypothetical protein KA405_06670 [Patescibacteria group bacterium]|nr:hypothetical protein [Patescibacteria group bacterium]